MAVSQDNTRILITISKDLQNQLKKKAEKEHRSVSNLCSKILSEYLKREDVNK